MQFYFVPELGVTLNDSQMREYRQTGVSPLASLTEKHEAELKAIVVEPAVGVAIEPVEPVEPVTEPVAPVEPVAPAVEPPTPAVEPVVPVEPPTPAVEPVELKRGRGRPPKIS